MTFAVLNRPLRGLDQVTRVLGLVEFHNGVKALGLSKTTGLRLDMEVKAAWEPVREISGQTVYGLTFEAVDEQLQPGSEAV